jgi:hypothetical protein
VGTVIWQRPLVAEGLQATARAIFTQNGRVLFEVSTRLDALGAPTWEPLQEVPESFIECAGAIMAESSEKTVELTLAECPPIQHRGQWKRKRRSGWLSRVAASFL